MQRLLSFGCALLAGFAAMVTTAETVAPTDWVVFASATCEECEWLKTDFFPALEVQVGAPLPVIRFVDLDNPDNYEILVLVEETLDVSGTEVPAVLIGPNMLYGKKAVANWGSTLGNKLSPTKLPDDVIPLVEKAESETYREMLGLAPPPKQGEQVNTEQTQQPPTPTDDHAQLVDIAEYTDANLLFFETAGCKKCARAVRQLTYAAGKVPGIRVFRMVTRDPHHKSLQFAVATRLGVPFAHRLTTPAFATGTDILIGEDITDAKLIEMLKNIPTQKPFWATWNEKQELAEAEKQIQLAAGRMTLPTVIAAGLIDGINPCAFAVIVFLVSYLTLTGRMGKKFAIIYGLTFAAGVYVCYLLIGLGFFQVLDFMQRWRNVTKGLFVAMGAICLLFAVGAAVDTIRAARNGVSKMKFGMPKGLHKIVHRLIREDVSKQALGVGAFVVGIAVSSIELVCTGQIYLPIIIFINSTAAGLKSVILLIVYNIAFIIPLIVVVFLGASGMGSEKLAKWGRKHAVTTRALTCLLVLGLAGVMFYMAHKA
jgi:cytochrome c biogenesis protein CcdA